MKNRSKTYWIFLILLSLSNQVFADVLYITKGTPAAFDGFLFDTEKGKQVKQRLVERDYFEKLSQSLTIQVNLYEGIETRSNEKYKILMDRNDDLSKNLNAERSLGNWERLGIFGLGVLATILVLYGVQHVSK